MNRDWKGYERAKKLRHWSTIEYVAERVAASDLYDGLLIVGSFAKDLADAASDIDLMVVVAEGGFNNGWEARETLQPSGALYAWDVQPEPERQWAARKFITRDIVKVEIGVCDPEPASARLAEPYVVLEGRPEVADRYRHVEPPTPAQLQEAAAELRDDGLVPDIERRYGELMKALRASWSSTQAS